MIVELGASSFEVVRMTAQFSNAVLVAVLPYVSDVAKRLELPIPQPVTAAQIVHCSVKPLREWGAEIGLDSGWVFVFEHGYVDTIQGPREFFGVQDFDRVPEYFGEVKISKDQAIKLARDALTKLNISLETVFAEQEPRAAGPVNVGTNVVPHYHIQWPYPWGVGQAPVCVDVDVDGSTGRVERLVIRNKTLERPLPNLAVAPERDPTSPVWPRVNPRYAHDLIPFVLKAVDDYGGKLGLPVPRPLTTNHIARFKLEEDRNSPRAEVELTNGWRFVFDHSQVDAFYAPDDLFSPHREKHPIRIKDFLGKWNLTEKGAQDLVRKTLAKLHYPPNLVHLEIEPQVDKPAVPGIPRFMFRWNYVTGQFLQSSIYAEVDADKGTVKSLYFYDASFYNPGPEIDAPLLLPAASRAPAAPLATPTQKTAPRRPLPHVVPPK